jgi:hypothetical protein
MSIYRSFVCIITPLSKILKCQRRPSDKGKYAFRNSQDCSGEWHVVRGLHYLCTLAFAVSCAQSRSLPSSGKSPSNSNQSPEERTAEETAEVISVEAQTFVTALQGAWSSECIAETAPSTLHWIEEYAFSQDKAQTLTRYFSDADCTVPYSKSIHHYMYHVGAAADYAGSGTFEVDLTVVKSEFMAFDAGLLVQLGADTAYGYTNWQEGIPFDITGKTYGPGSEANWEAGRVLYALMIVKQDYFNTSVLGNGTSPVNRPKELSSFSFVRRGK